MMRGIIIIKTTKKNPKAPFTIGGVRVKWSKLYQKWIVYSKQHGEALEEFRLKSEARKFAKKLAKK